MIEAGRILIVDDEPSARDTLEAFLAPEGYELAFARDGREALACAAQLAPDLILLDVMMPDVDGFEVCRRLRADPVLDAVHIVMLTALDDRDARLRGLEVGADDFISKPFDGAELQARVRTVMQVHRYRRLLTERAKFQWVVEQADEGYVMLDEAGRLVYANPRARRYLALPEEGAATPPAFRTVAVRQYQLRPAEAWEDWPQILVDEEVTRYLVRPQSSKSSVLWLQVDAVEMPAGTARYLIRLRDVTEEVLTRNRIWTFDAQISHKVKTPLGQLTGTLQLLDFDLDTLTKEEIRDDISEAYQSAERLKGRILDIFRYLESLDLTRVPLARCCAGDIPELLAQVQGELGLESVAVSTDALRDPEVLIPLACNSLELMLWELCENAQKFHPDHAPTLTVDVATVPAGVQLRVQDDGRHLPSDELERIWAPYYQVEGLFTGEVPGMGLGLAVVASLVWGIGGACRAYNRSDRPGLVVELFLPRVQDKGVG
jgi:DNA-binding response OmpR family regulator